MLRDAMMDEEGGSVYGYLRCLSDEASRSGVWQRSHEGLCGRSDVVKFVQDDAVGYISSEHDKSSYGTNHLESWLKTNCSTTS